MDQNDIDNPPRCTDMGGDRNNVKSTPHLLDENFFTNLHLVRSLSSFLDVGIRNGFHFSYLT